MTVRPPESITGAFPAGFDGHAEKTAAPIPTRASGAAHAGWSPTHVFLVASSLDKFVTVCSHDHQNALLMAHRLRLCLLEYSNMS